MIQTIDIQQTFRLLFDLPELEISLETYQLQSIGDPLAFAPCGDGSEHGENPIPEGEPQEPLSDDCACEQSLYWANLEGYNCEELNILYFYHSDYLGSVEFVTDMKGEPYQPVRRSLGEGGFFLNTVWGENIENQFAKTYTSFSSRFRFKPRTQMLRWSSGKEWEGQALRNRPVAYFSEGARLPRGRGNFYLPAIALAKAGGARYVVYPERSLGDPKISVVMTLLSIAPALAKRLGWGPEDVHLTYSEPIYREN